MASFSDESVDPGHGRLVDSTHPPNKQRLLPEIIPHIISFVIPNCGLTISNDSNRNSDFDTIISLLKTSIKIKNENLRQIYRQPLHLVITSGQDCTCRSLLESSRDTFEFPLRRATSLPLGNWPVLNIHFAPDPKSSCFYSQAYSRRVPDYGRPTWQVDAAYTCVGSQSEILATWLREYAVDESSTTLKTAFTFAEVWVDSTDITQQLQLLYNVWTLFDFMSPWTWTAATPEALTDQIKFPHMLFSGYSRDDELADVPDDVPDDYEAAGARHIVEDIESQFSVWWSPRSQVIPRQSFNMLGTSNYSRGWAYTRFPAMDADEFLGGTGLLCIKITPDMTGGDNGLGIWQPAMLRESPDNNGSASLAKLSSMNLPAQVKPRLNTEDEATMNL
ncbi:hypothetical protein H2202_007143 [Exophiala xenobiotica]|nr:hypothetical protein H2202_007143 [Exophiala xenobiotica]